MRPGGRVQTWSDPFADGLYTEAGVAAIVPVEPDLVLRYLRLFNIALAPLEPEISRTSLFPGSENHRLRRGGRSLAARSEK